MNLQKTTTNNFTGKFPSDRYSTLELKKNYEIIKSEITPITTIQTIKGIKHIECTINAFWHLKTFRSIEGPDTSQLVRNTGWQCIHRGLEEKEEGAIINYQGFLVC